VIGFARLVRVMADEPCALPHTDAGSGPNLIA